MRNFIKLITNTNKVVKIKEVLNNDGLECYGCHSPTIQKLVLGDAVYPLCNRCLLEHVTNNQKALEMKKYKYDDEAEQLIREFVECFSDKLNVLIKKLAIFKMQPL